MDPGRTSCFWRQQGKTGDTAAHGVRHAPSLSRKKSRQACTTAACSSAALAPSADSTPGDESLGTGRHALSKVPTGTPGTLAMRWHRIVNQRADTRRGQRRNYRASRVLALHHEQMPLARHRRELGKTSGRPVRADKVNDRRRWVLEPWLASMRTRSASASSCVVPHRHLMSNSARVKAEPAAWPDRQCGDRHPVRHAPGRRLPMLSGHGARPAP